MIESLNNNNEVKLAGINIDVTKVLGDALAEQFISQISEEELDLIVKNAKNEIWTKDYNGETILKKKKTDSYWDKETDTAIVAFAKSSLNDKMKEYISEKIEEYTNSDEYKSKANEIVKKIINYALDGYKTDMINILRKRLAIDPLTESYENFIYNNSNLDNRLNNIESTLQDIMKTIYNN